MAEKYTGFTVLLIQNAAHLDSFGYVGVAKEKPLPDCCTTYTVTHVANDSYLHSYTNVNVEIKMLFSQIV